MNLNINDEAVFGEDLLHTSKTIGVKGTLYFRIAYLHDGFRHSSNYAKPLTEFKIDYHFLYKTSGIPNLEVFTKTNRNTVEFNFAIEKDLTMF